MLLLLYYSNKQKELDSYNVDLLPAATIFCSHHVPEKDSSSNQNTN